MHSVTHVFEKISVKSAISLWRYGHCTMNNNPTVYGISLSDRVIGLTESEQMLLTMVLVSKLKLSELPSKLGLKSKSDPVMKRLFTILCDCLSDVVDSSVCSTTHNNAEVCCVFLFSPSQLFLFSNI